MTFKLLESAQTRWRAVNAPHLVALVRAGARFEKGTLVERPDESGGDAHAHPQVFTISQRPLGNGVIHAENGNLDAVNGR